MGFHPGEARAPLTLTAGGLVLSVYPELGARVGRLFRQQTDGGIFDYLVPLDATHYDVERWPRAGCFPMLPFTNKFAGNVFTWHGQQVRVACDPDAGFLHGWGLRHAWSVEASGDAHCALSLRVAASDMWPWDYEASLMIQLDANGADFTLSLINRSRTPMPAGLGFHPHFPLHGGAKARVQADARWQTTSESGGLPAVRDRLAEPLHLNMDGGGLPGPVSTWFCETSRCVAELRYPASGRELRVSSRDARYMVLHSPLSGRYVCLEPSSHLAGRLDPSADVAQPDQTVTLSMRIEAV